MTTDAERALLLRIARDAIAAHVTGGSPPLREAFRQVLADARSWTGKPAEAGQQPAVGSSRQSAVGRHPSTPVEGRGLDDRRGGAFVSLHHKGELRGCIGHIEADDSLPRTVARCAVAACSADPRFPPVAPMELPEIQIELSLLGPLERLAGPAEIEIGRHGLVAEMGRQRGLLLPQVATEWQWDAETFFSQTCRKAGLPADSWRHGATMWKFEAEVFAET